MLSNQIAIWPSGAIPLFFDVYFGEAPFLDNGYDSGIGLVYGNPLSERNRFLSDLSGLVSGVVDFEDQTHGSYNSKNITFTGSSVIGTFTSTTNFSIIDGMLSGGSLGRYNTTQGLLDQFGDPDPYGHWLEMKDNVTITFSQPVRGFAFYGTDFGDFLGTVHVSVHDTTGATTNYVINQTTSNSNGGLIFWGFLSNQAIFDSITLFCVYDVPPGIGDEDVFGFDDLMIKI